MTRNSTKKSQLNHNKNAVHSAYNYDYETAEDFYASSPNTCNGGSSYHYTASTNASNSSSSQLKWYENTEYQYKLIYKIEKSIPAVVQKILEEMGFIEWDPAVHHEDQWNILWKSQR